MEHPMLWVRSTTDTFVWELRTLSTKSRSHLSRKLTSFWSYLLDTSFFFYYYFFRWSIYWKSTQTDTALLRWDKQTIFVSPPTQADLSYIINKSPLLTLYHIEKEKENSQARWVWEMVFYHLLTRHDGTLLTTIPTSATRTTRTTQAFLFK